MAGPEGVARRLSLVTPSPSPQAEPAQKVRGRRKSAMDVAGERRSLPGGTRRRSPASPSPSPSLRRGSVGPGRRTSVGAADPRPAGPGKPAGEAQQRLQEEALAAAQEDAERAREAARTMSSQLQVLTHRLYNEEVARKAAEARLEAARQGQAEAEGERAELQKAGESLQRKLGRAKEELERLAEEAAAAAERTAALEAETAATREANEKLRSNAVTLFNWQERCKELEDKVRAMAAKEKNTYAKDQLRLDEIAELKELVANRDKMVEGARKAARDLEEEAERLQRRVRDQDQQLSLSTNEKLRKENMQLQENLVKIVTRIREEEVRLSKKEEEALAYCDELMRVKGENAQLRRAAEELGGRVLVAEERERGREHEVSALSDRMAEMSAGWQDDRIARLEASQDAVTLHAHMEVLRKTNAKLLTNLKQEQQFRSQSVLKQQAAERQLRAYSEMVDGLTSSGLSDTLLRSTPAPGTAGPLPQALGSPLARALPASPYASPYATPVGAVPGGSPLRSPILASPALQERASTVPHFGADSPSLSFHV